MRVENDYQFYYLLTGGRFEMTDWDRSLRSDCYPIPADSGILLTEPMASHWTTQITDCLGALPFGGDLVRTDPGGPPQAPVAFLGVYPAATRVVKRRVGVEYMNLPLEVERTSFEPGSESGKYLDERYLEPLGLDRRQAFMFDMMPYFLANTARSGKDGRSMWDNICAYQKATDEQLAVKPRPTPEKLLEECRSMPGNLERLVEYLGSCRPELLLTLGTEAAAFSRGCGIAKVVKELLYAVPVEISLLGIKVRVVHLTHPGNLMRNPAWRERHEVWCRGAGREIVQEFLRRAGPDRFL